MVKFVLLLTLVMSVFAASKPRQISVRTYPETCMVPCIVTVHVTIPVSENNRAAAIELDGPEFHGTQIQLDEHAHVTYDIEYKLNSSGEYDVKAVLYDSVHEVARSVTKLQVVGIGAVIKRKR